MSGSQYLKVLQDYVTALETVKKKYEAEAKAKALEITDENVDEIYRTTKSMSDNRFALDYMLQVNGKLLNYLKFYQKGLPTIIGNAPRRPSALGAGALDRILNQVAKDVVINEGSDIHEVIKAVEIAVLKHAPDVAAQLKKDAQFRSWVYWALVPLPITTAILLGPGMPFYAASMALVGSSLAPLVFFAAMFFIAFPLTVSLALHSQWYARNEVRNLYGAVVYRGFVVPSLPEEKKESLFKRTYNYVGPETKVVRQQGDGGRIELPYGPGFFNPRSKQCSELRSAGMDKELKRDVEKAYSAPQLS